MTRFDLIARYNAKKDAGDTPHPSLLLGLAAPILIGVWLFTFFTPASAQAPSPASKSAAIISGLHGRVLGTDGKPVPGVTIFVATPQRSNLRIRNGKVEDDDAKVARAITDVDGKYELRPQSGQFVLQVISDTGYGQADQDVVAKNADIQLIAWGRIQGKVMLGTKPGVNIQLQAGSIDPSRTNAPRLSMVNRATTDADGKFTMDRVIPGPIGIIRNFEQQSGSDLMIFNADVGTTQVKAGQTTTVNFGGVGRPVTGKFIFPSGMNPSDYFINARAIPLAKAPADWRNYFLDVDPDHNFIISNVEPGDYTIHVFLQKGHGNQTAQPAQIKFTMPRIPGIVSDEPLVIPDIQLQ